MKRTGFEHPDARRPPAAAVAAHLRLLEEHARRWAELEDVRARDRPGRDGHR